MRREPPYPEAAHRLFYLSNIAPYPITIVRGNLHYIEYSYGNFIRIQITCN